MKKIFMILPSGEEVFCTEAPNLLMFLKYLTGFTIVPFNGNEEYTHIENIYSEDAHQFVTYKSV